MLLIYVLLEIPLDDIVEHNIQHEYNFRRLWGYSLNAHKHPQNFVLPVANLIRSMGNENTSNV